MTPRARARFLARATACVLLAGACLFSLEPSAVARADALRARLIAPTAQDELLNEALARVKGELSAAGFRVAVQRETGATQPQTSIARVKAEDATTAVLVVQRQPQESAEIKTLEFWVYEPWDREIAIIHSEIDEDEPSLSAQRGAVQAVEVLRAVLARRGIDARTGAGAQLRRQEATKSESAPRDREEATKSESVPRDQAEPSSLVRVSAGFALWKGFDGLGSTVTPIAALAVALPGLLPSRDLALDLRASAAGLGWSSELVLDEGRVEVRQALLMGEVVLRLRPRALLQPLLSLAGGAYAVSIEAEVETPFIARSPHTWSGLFGGGTGLMLAVSTNFAASLEAQLLFATAPSEVSVDGRVAATAGAPILLIGMQLMGGF